MPVQPSHAAPGSGKTDPAPLPAAPPVRRALALLMAMGEEQEPRDPARAIECFRQAADLAGGLGEGADEADALLHLGRCELRRGNAPAAEEPLSRALELARAAAQGAAGAAEAEDNSARAALHTAVLNAVGLLRLRQGRLDEAGTALRESLSRTTASAGSGPFSLARAETLEFLGMVYAHRGEPDAALRHHEEALELRRAAADAPGEARSWNQIGNLRHRMGQYAEAMASYRRALERFRELEDARAIAAAANNLASTLLRLGEMDEARTLFEECRGRFEALGEETRVADVLSNLGLLAQAQGRAEEAEAHYRESLRLRRAAGDAPGESHSLTNLGHLALARGRCEEAWGLAGESVRILERVGYEETLASAQVCGGSALLEMGRVDEARAIAERARSVAERTRAADQRAESLLLVARVRLQDAQVDPAVESAREALARAEEIGDPELLASACCVLGSALREQGALDEAKLLLARAGRILRGWEQSFERARVLVEEGRLLTQSGAHQAAAERLRRADAIFLRLGNTLWRSRTLSCLAAALQGIDPSSAEEARGLSRALGPSQDPLGASARTIPGSFPEGARERGDSGGTRRAAELAALRALLDSFRGTLEEAEPEPSRLLDAFDRFVRDAGLGAGADFPGESGIREVADAALALARSVLAERAGARPAGAEAPSEAAGMGPLIGASPAMREVYRWIERAARADTTVLVRGESGTGKELVARCLHERSARSGRPFVAINCPSIPRDLIESELFGHERGAFTGATEARRGRIELAQGGTLFLDEIGDIPVAVQTKLLRFLQEREIERVGGRTSLAVDVRLVTATSRDLEAAMRRGDFREDLYYRLAVVPIHLPPLRERTEDIPLLVAEFLRAMGPARDGEARRLTVAALDGLRAHSWPGNVRELRNAVEYMATLSGGSLLEERHLPETCRRPRETASNRSARGADGPARSAGQELRPGETLASRLMEVEATLLRLALEACDWNQSAAARHLGVTESLVRNRMRQYGIRRAP